MVGISGAQFAVAALGYSERPLESLLSMSRLPADPNAVPEFLMNRNPLGVAAAKPNLP